MSNVVCKTLQYLDYKGRTRDSVICKTLLCEDGVVGLNGYQYLLDDEGNEMEFASEEDAVKFLLDNGYSKDWIGEWLEFETIEKKDI